MYIYIVLIITTIIHVVTIITMIIIKTLYDKDNNINDNNNDK